MTPPREDLGTLRAGKQCLDVAVAFSVGSRLCSASDCMDALADLLASDKPAGWAMDVTEVWCLRGVRFVQGQNGPLSFCGGREGLTALQEPGGGFEAAVQDTADNFGDQVVCEAGLTRLCFDALRVVGCCIVEGFLDEGCPISILEPVQAVEDYVAPRSVFIWLRFPEHKPWEYFGKLRSS